MACLISENSPCITFLNDIWHRGIIWKMISANRYEILMVDTMEFIEFDVDNIQVCPKKLIQSKLRFGKVRMTHVIPKKRIRITDLCNYLSNILLDKEKPFRAINTLKQCDHSLNINLYLPNCTRLDAKLIQSSFYEKFR